jgi:hypothetical protein
MKLAAIAILVSLSTFISCKTFTEPDTSTGLLNGVYKYYYANGNLYLEVSYKDSILHGTTKQYFKNGTVYEQTEYDNGLKHGLEKRFYEDGKLCLETPYVKGKVHGIQRKFRKDGALAFEAPYHQGSSCVGLKEYYISGNLVENYPAIVIEEVQDNQLSLRISLSQNVRHVEFYKGKLTEGKFISNEAESIAVETPGISKLDYLISSEAFATDTVNIIAKVKTDLGNYYIAQAQYSPGAINAN